MQLIPHEARWRAEKLHWPFPDPAAVSGSEEDKLQSFRNTRDMIYEKLRGLWGG